MTLMMMQCCTVPPPPTQGLSRETSLCRSSSVRMKRIKSLHVDASHAQRFAAMTTAPRRWRRPATATTFLAFTLIPASALLFPSSSSSRTCCFTSQTRVGCIHSLLPSSSLSVTTNRRHWSLAMIDDANEDEINNTEDDENDEDLHEPSDINVALRRISWLPSVLLGKQAHRSP